VPVGRTDFPRWPSRTIEGRELDRSNLRQAQVFCRSDDHLATPGVAALARKEQIHIESRFSDHAPLTIDYDINL
jgi:exodeoxyribonuclease-3